MNRVGIDIGGTFTDLVAITEDGRVATHKVASTRTIMARASSTASNRCCPATLDR